MCALRLPAFFFFFLIRLEVCWQSFWNCQEDRWGSFAIIISWNTLTWACAQFSGGQNKIVHVPINIKVNETTEEKKQKKNWEVTEIQPVLSKTHEEALISSLFTCLSFLN